MNLNERKRELINEIIFSLPSKRMIDVVSIGSINYKGKNIIIKSRFKEDELPMVFLKNPPVVYDKFIVDFNHDYLEIFDKNIIFDTSILYKRGLVALDELVEICEHDFIF